MLKFQLLYRTVITWLLILLPDIHQHVLCGGADVTVYAGSIPTPVMSPPIAVTVDTMTPAPTSAKGLIVGSAAEPKGGMTPKSAPTGPKPTPITVPTDDTITTDDATDDDGPSPLFPPALGPSITALTPALTPLLPPNLAPIVDSICFSGKNTVVVQGNKDPISLHQLKIGDYVQVGSNEYSQVYSFGHYDHDKEALFVQIQFENDNNDDDTALELSSRHLVFTAQNQVKTASEVIVGDALRSDKAQDRIVKSVQGVIRRGVYAPLTKSGSIVVSGVISSNFVKMLDHDMAPASSSSWPNQHHIGKSYMYPHQLFCSYFMKICQKETYYQGYSYYVYHLVQIGKMIKYSGSMVSSFIWFLSIPLFSIVYVMEVSTSSFMILPVIIGTVIGAVTWFISFIRRRRQ